jgi:hypothetical protein
MPLREATLGRPPGSAASICPSPRTQSQTAKWPSPGSRLSNHTPAIAAVGCPDQLSDSGTRNPLTIRDRASSICSCAPSPGRSQTRDGSALFEMSCIAGLWSAPAPTDKLANCSETPSETAFTRIKRLVLPHKCLSVDSGAVRDRSDWWASTAADQGIRQCVETSRDGARVP